MTGHYIKSLEEMKREFLDYKSRMHLTKKHVADTRRVVFGLWRLSRREHRDVWGDLAHLKDTVSNKKVDDTAVKAAFRAYMSSIQNGRCCYCRQWLVSTAYAKPIEHIMPRDAYPQFSLYFWNLAVACADCNGIKSNSQWQLGLVVDSTYPRPDAFEKMFHPRFHEYSHHVRYVIVETNGSSISLYKGISEQGSKLCIDLLEKVAVKRAFLSGNDNMRKSISTVQGYREALENIGHPMLERFILSLDASMADVVHSARNVAAL